jgi:hypothetical protein
MAKMEECAQKKRLRAEARSLDPEEPRRSWAGGYYVLITLDALAGFAWGESS